MTENKNKVDLKSLKVRHIEWKDLEEVNKLMETEMYDVGLPNLKLYYSSSNTKIWKCIENEKGEIFAIDIGNMLPNGLDYGYILIIRPDYRNQGISNLFKSQWADHPYMGSESLKSVSIYSKDVLQCWRGKMLVYYGLVSGEVGESYWQSVSHLIGVHQLTLESINEKNVTKLYRYDRSIIKIDRQKFIQKWCCAEGSNCVAAFDQKGRCLGYGVLRIFPGHTRYGITPLYAETPDVASCIFGYLAAKVNRQYLYVPCMAHQRVTMDFCRAIRLSFINCEIRDCNLKALDYVKTIDMSKVYTTHDYWPV